MAADFGLAVVGGVLLVWIYLAGVTIVKARHRVASVLVVLVLIAQAYRNLDLQGQNAAAAATHTQELKKLREAHVKEIKNLGEDMQRNFDLQAEGLRKLSRERGREIRRTPTVEKPQKPAVESKPQEAATITAEVRVDGDPRIAAQQVARIRVTTNPAVSTNEAAPYAIEVILQTDVTIQNPAFVIKTDGEIHDGTITPRGTTSVMMNVRWGLSNDRHAFFFSYSYPAFSPDMPIVIRLVSKSPLKIIGVDRL
jgi:hypothetical protein